MAAWMLASILAAAAFAAVGLLAERGMTLLERPSRWLWLAVMAMSATWPLRPGRVAADATASTEAGLSTPGAASGLGELVTTTVPGAVDGLLLGVWGLASALLLLTLLLSAETLRQDRRRWQPGVVAGERVYLSGGVGPAVVGWLDTRIVIPRWVLELEDDARRLVVLHERQHVLAGDHRLLVPALLLLVALPWCLPLWWQLHRLRGAVETDCDRRMLEGGASPGSYAHTLLAVAERQRRRLLPLSTMAGSSSILGRRIRHIATAVSPRRARTAAGWLALAVLPALLSWSLPSPVRPSLVQVAQAARPSGPYGPPLPSGALRGDPGEARLAAEIATHHGEAVAADLEEGSVIWFVVDRSGAVVHTGIEQGAERDVIARIRARHPSETSEYFLAWSDEPTASGPTHVIWLLPPP